MGRWCALAHAAAFSSCLVIAAFSGSVPVHVRPFHLSDPFAQGAPWCVNSNGSYRWTVTIRLESLVGNSSLSSARMEFHCPGPTMMDRVGLVLRTTARSLGTA